MSKVGPLAMLDMEDSGKPLPELYAYLKANMIGMTPPADKRVWAQKCLLRLRGLVAENQSGRAAARAVQQTLSCYVKGKSAADERRGYCISASRVDQLCFEIWRLLGRIPCERTLAAMYVPVSKHGG